MIKDVPIPECGPDDVLLKGVYPLIALNDPLLTNTPVAACGTRVDTSYQPILDPFEKVYAALMLTSTRANSFPDSR